MPELTPLITCCIIVLGGAIGFLSGLFGVGGGFLLTPMLNIAFGVPMQIAIGSSLCQMIGTAATATIRHWKDSAVDVKLALLMLGGMIGGVEVGARLLEKLEQLGNVSILGRDVEWVWLIPMSIFVVLLLVIGIGTLKESLSTHRTAKGGGEVVRRVGRGLFNRIPIPPMAALAGTEGRAVPLIPVVCLSFGIGITQGFLGLGGGIVIVPTLIYWVGCSTRAAVGTSLLLIVAGAIAGTVSHALRDNVSLTLVVLLLTSSTVGAYLGAMVHHRLKAYHIRLYLSFVLFAALLVILIKMVLVKFGVASGR